MRIGTTWWIGDDQKRRGCYPYDERYPRALRSQLAAVDQELTVLGNDPAADRQLQQPTKFFGWWSKLEWFAPWNRDLRPCLVIDLDTFIVGDIAPILALDPARLWLIRQFFGTKQLGESGLFIAPVDCDKIWNDVERLRERERPYGDGDILRQYPHSFIPDKVDGIYSYKAHKLTEGYPLGARVICFHGQPKPPNAVGWASSWFNFHSL